MYAKLLLPSGTEVLLPIVSPTMGSSGIDVTGLYSATKHITYDPGFFSTGSCASSITYTDGENGVLLYRGYPIEELAMHSTFLDVAYLLQRGELPSSEEKYGFEQRVKKSLMVHEQLRSFFQGFPRNAHPMAIMVGVVGALSAFYYEKFETLSDRYIIAEKIIAKMPTIAAMAYKYSLGQPFVYPSSNFDYVSNILNMMFDVPYEKYNINPLFVKAIDVLMILHADHEQNASTSTVRMAASSKANPFACIASGITALWGPAHGGANEAVLTMLEEIGSVSNIKKYIDRAKDKNDSFRLNGFGHRIYKSYDPRASIVQSICHEIIKDNNDPLFELALELEYQALQDDYFKEKKLYPNIDFYSGIIMQAIGIPKSMFTVFFAIARSAGWVAHWLEMSSDDVSKISRPRQLYTGYSKRSYVR